MTTDDSSMAGAGAAFRTVQAERLHVAAQLDLQVAASRGHDPCRRLAARTALWMRKVHTSAYNAAMARTLAASSRTTLARLQKEYAAATSDEDRSRLQGEIDDHETYIDEQDAAAEVWDTEHQTAVPHFEKSIDALERCREKHPYEHDCGERGGPGIRRDDGKCYSWVELRRLAH